MSLAFLHYDNSQNEFLDKGNLDDKKCDKNFIIITGLDK